MAEPRKLARREFIQAASLGAVGLITFTNRSITNLLSGRTIGEAHAQDSVKNLRPFSLKTLKGLDSQMDGKYRRRFIEKGEKDISHFTSALTNGDRDTYITVGAFTLSETMERKIVILNPEDPKNRNGNNLETVVDLQKLFDFYREACKTNGCERKEMVWPKIMFQVLDRGVNTFATFVDNKPRPNDSSDLVAGYPLIGLVYNKEKNEVSPRGVYFRIE